jgi:hypothetical protein
LCHAEGEGVLRNPSEAAGWFRRAAQQGHGEAQLKLGLLYERGEGVGQSFARAAHWYRLAAEQEVEGALTRLTLLLARTPLRPA